MSSTDAREIGVGMLGYAFMGKAHSNAFRREIVADEAIGLFDNGGPNSLHAEPTIAAAEAGKHVLCEKPLGRTADESYEMWRRVEAAGVKHMCAFNYRFVPAMRLARELLEAGEIGEVLHFRGRWEWWWPPGHIIGWEHTFMHEIHHLLRAIADDGDVASHGATFEDGYRAAEVCDAIIRSAESGRREEIFYR